MSSHSKPHKPQDCIQFHLQAKKVNIPQTQITAVVSNPRIGDKKIKKVTEIVKFGATLREVQCVTIVAFFNYCLSRHCL